MDSYRDFLRDNNYSENTIISYVHTKDVYEEMYGEVTKENLAKYRDFCIEHYKVASVNQKIRGINKYLEYKGMSQLSLKGVKTQRKCFVENVISNKDYEIFLEYLQTNGLYKWYFIIKFLAVTGLRVSELIKLQVSDIVVRYTDLYGKGEKCRRIFFPEKACAACLAWIKAEGIRGYIFQNRFGEPLTVRGVAYGIKRYGISCGIRGEVLHPHSFRHFFAKNFLRKGGDIMLLADLLGHSSLETTRIYLRNTMEEQMCEINKIVTW